ncbi:MAG: Lrp/AsnC family transcriptional regulator [Candidatus Hodarchaeales archaeon]
MANRRDFDSIIRQRKTSLIDSKDFDIICLLEKEGKKPLSEIAEHVGLTTASVSNRLKRLEKEGILVKYVPLIRIEKLGFAKDLILLIQIEPGANLELISASLRKIESVKCIYKLIGEYDLLVQLCCIGDTELEVTLKAINDITGLSKISKSLVQHKIRESFQDLIE